MPRFFVEPPVGETVLLTGEDAQHISKALRMRVGQSLTLCDGQGWDYACEITAAEPSGVALKVMQKTPCVAEPTTEIVLYQALPKGDKLDFIVQKAVELGVSSIVPVQTEFCVSRPDAKKWEKKSERLNRIALEAAKQSGRGRVPQVQALLSFSQAISRMKSTQCPILLYEKGSRPLTEILQQPAGSYAVFVGSEGGFSQQEAEQARCQGVQIASLGPRILRCETAPIAALACLMYATGNF